MRHQDVPGSRQSESSKQCWLRHTTRCLLLSCRFQMEFAPKPPPGMRRKSSGSLFAWETAKREAALSPVDQGKTGKAASGSFPGHGRPTRGRKSPAEHQPRALTGGKASRRLSAAPSRQELLACPKTRRWLGRAPIPGYGRRMCGSEALPSPDRRTRSPKNPPAASPSPPSSSFSKPTPRMRSQHRAELQRGGAGPGLPSGRAARMGAAGGAERPSGLLWEGA